MRKSAWSAALLASVTGASVGLGGCIKLQAPDKPIEINLNVNVRQEVIVRLQDDVRELIEQNPNIF